MPVGGMEGRMTTKQDGARTGPGQPRLVPGQTTESVQVRLDPARKAKALAIGNGNVANGVRAAIDAYPAKTQEEE